MQTQAKFCLSLTKLNTSCFSAAQTLSLTPQVVPSAYTKNLFFWLSVRDDEVLSTPKL